MQIYQIKSHKTTLKQKTFHNQLRLLLQAINAESILISLCQQCSLELLRIKKFKGRCIDSLKNFIQQFENVAKEEESESYDEAMIEVVANDLAYSSDRDCNSDFEWQSDVKPFDTAQLEVEFSKPKRRKRQVADEFKPRKPTKRADVDDTSKTKNKFCSVCNTSYSTTQIKHLLAEHGIKRNNLAEITNAKDGFLIECKICQKVLGDKKTFRAHFLLHAKLPEALKCTYCEEVFEDIGKHKYHMQKHETPWYECDLCDRKFDRKDRIEFHIKSRHLKAKRCRTCNQLFPQDEFFLHMQEQGCRIDPNSAVCDHCGMNFRNLGELKAHVKHLQ